MIDKVLKCIEEDINDYFRVKLPNTTNNENKIVLSNIVNSEGVIAIQGSDKVILSLYNIEKEPVLNNGGTVNSSFSGGSNGPLNLNIYILFSAYFSSGNYAQGLMFISYIIGYFQKKNAYTRSNTPALVQLDTNVEKLIFEITTLNTDQTNSLWGALGTKLMPFVMYKVRTLSFDESIIKEYRPAITKIEK